MGGLRLEGLVRRYGEHVVLEIPSLDLEPGTVYCLLGPSGAGKTTLLRVLALLDRPDQGRVEYPGGWSWTAGGENGLSGNDLVPRRRSMAYLPHQPYLFRSTVVDNVGYALRVRGVPAAESRARAVEMMEKVGITGLSGKRTTDLSAGQAQRVALARALVYEPEMLFLDEPTANLDPDNAQRIEDLVTETLGRKALVVLVTHDHQQARRVGGKILYLAGGKLVDSPSS